MILAVILGACSRRAPLPLIPSPPSPTATPPGGGLGDIVFVSDRAGDRDIWRMRTDGSGLVQLSSGSGGDEYPRWSPDGGKILYVSTTIWNTGVLRLMNGDGSGNVALSPVSVLDGGGDWSPDGSKIVFSRSLGGSSPSHIWLMNADGSGAVDLTPASTASLSSPFWSADGSKIHYYELPAPCFLCTPLCPLGPALLSMNPDGSGSGPFSPSISIPGLENVFILDECPVSGEFYLSAWGCVSPPYGNYLVRVDASGSLLGTILDAGQAVFSPDGTRIAYWSNTAEIFVSNADGSSAVNVTNDPAWDSNPDWR